MSQEEQDAKTVYEMEVKVASEMLVAYHLQAFRMLEEGSDRETALTLAPAVLSTIVQGAMDFAEKGHQQRLQEKLQERFSETLDRIERGEDVDITGGEP